MDVMQGVRAVRRERLEPKRQRGPQRAPAEQAEIARRVAIYTEQYARTGRIDWLPHREILANMD